MRKQLSCCCQVLLLHLFALGGSVEWSDAGIMVTRLQVSQLKPDVTIFLARLWGKKQENMENLGFQLREQHLEWLLPFQQEVNSSPCNLQTLFPHTARCLKITEKVSFNIASEASYVYILSGEKFIKRCQNWSIWRVFKNWSLRSNSVTR